MTLALRKAEVRAGPNVLLAPVTATLRPGRLACIVGPNGAGKSTLVSLLSGARRPDAGEVLLDGAPLQGVPLEALARRRAVMLQESAVAFDFSAAEVCGLGRYPHRLQPSRHEDRIVAEALAAASVAALASRSFATLSGGEKARVQLARALAQVWEPDPAGASRWLLLDEPTAALDLRHQHEVLQRVRALAEEEGVGVVAVLHDVNLALRYGDDALLLAAGRDARFGTVGDVLVPERIRDVWQVGCEWVRDAGGRAHLLFG